MNEIAFQRMQAAQLRQLLENAANDPILAPQLKERLDAAEHRIAEMERAGGELFAGEEPALPRVALFLRGGGVDGSEGIQAGLAGEALIQYEKMYVAQALHDEQTAAQQSGRQRRKRGTGKPTLLFTGTPRGSFGLEFTAQKTGDSAALPIHAHSLRAIADTVTRIAESAPKDLDTTLMDTPPQVLHAMKRFFDTLGRYGTELRLAFPDAPPRAFNAETIHAAAERLDREIVEEESEYTGTFRGLTLESLYFDLVLDDGTLIKGDVAGDLAEDELERMEALTNKPCTATIQKTTIRKAGGVTDSRFVLLNATENE